MTGTAPWAAPEIFKSRHAREESDIWYVTAIHGHDLRNSHTILYRSVGATVVEMLTGKAPYKEEKYTSTNIMYLVGDGKINPLTSEAMKKHLASTERYVKDFLSKCFEL